MTSDRDGLPHANLGVMFDRNSDHRTPVAVGVWV